MKLDGKDCLRLPCEIKTKVIILYPYITVIFSSVIYYTLNFVILKPDPSQQSGIYTDFIFHKMDLIFIRGD